MFSGLLIILLPLIVGYLIPLHRESALRLDCLRYSFLYGDKPGLPG